MALFLGLEVLLNPYWRCFICLFDWLLLPPQVLMRALGSCIVSCLEKLYMCSSITVLGAEGLVKVYAGTLQSAYKQQLAVEIGSNHKSVSSATHINAL